MSGIFQFIAEHPDVWIFFGILAIMAGVNAARSREYKELLGRQAVKRNGVIKMNPLMYPRLYFPVDDQTVELRLRAKTKQSLAQTSLHCQLPGLSEYRLVLEKASLGTLFTKVSQALENQIPEFSEFEKNFDVFTNDQPVTQTIINHPDAQKALLEIMDMNPRLKVSRSQFRLAVDGIFKEDASNDCFLNNATIILRKILQESRLRA